MEIQMTIEARNPDIMKKAIEEMAAKLIRIHHSIDEEVSPADPEFKFERFTTDPGEVRRINEGTGKNEN